MKCELCGKKIIEYKHNLNKVLVSGLIKLFNYEGQQAKLKELNLTNSQFANFQKLRYFGLADKLSGVWYLSQRGENFIKGNIPVPKSVYTRNGNVVKSEGTIFVYQVKDLFQSREDWEEQARGGKIYE